MLERLRWGSGQVACPGFAAHDCDASQEIQVSTELNVLRDVRRFRQAIIDWAEGYRMRRRAAIEAGASGTDARAELLLWSKRYFKKEHGIARLAVE